MSRDESSNAAAAAADHGALTDRILEFLRSIGLAVCEAEVPEGSFLPGVRIERGGLRVDRARLRWPGDLLHEAGHLAVVPTALRSTLDDALQDLPEVAHGGEIEATAWAWAATRHLGLDSAVLFHDGGYHGRSVGLRTTFEPRAWPLRGSPCCPRRSCRAEPRPIRTCWPGCGAESPKGPKARGLARRSIRADLRALCNCTHAWQLVFDLREHGIARGVRRLQPGGDELAADLRVRQGVGQGLVQFGLGLGG